MSSWFEENIINIRTKFQWSFLLQLRNKDFYYFEREKGLTVKAVKSTHNNKFYIQICAHISWSPRKVARIIIGIHFAQNHRQTDLWSQVLSTAQDIRLTRRFHVGISVCATNIRIHNQRLWNWYITGNIFSLFNIPKWKRSLKWGYSVTLSSFHLLFGFKNCAQDFDMYEAPCGLSVVIFRDLLVVCK